jgi:YidC/Oxa1 family membrane protein insertase
VAATRLRLWNGRGWIDHLSLVQYHETTEPKSPAIELFSPSGSLQPFYAEFGSVNATDARFSAPSSGCSKS